LCLINRAFFTRRGIGLFVNLSKIFMGEIKEEKGTKTGSNYQKEKRVKDSFTKDFKGL